MLCKHIILQEEVARSDNYHYDRPQLRGRERRADKLSPFVAARKFYAEAPHAVRDSVKTEVIIELDLEVQHSHNNGKHNQKRHFEELQGHNLGTLGINSV